MHISIVIVMMHIIMRVIVVMHIIVMMHIDAYYFYGHDARLLCVLLLLCILLS